MLRLVARLLNNPQQGSASTMQPTEELEALSQIIEELNRRFGVDLSESDKRSIRDLEARLAGDAALTESFRVNPRSKARVTFDHVANDKLVDMFEANFKLYKLINDDSQFQSAIFEWMFERFCQSMEVGEGG